MIPARSPPPPHISLDLLILSGDGSVHGQRRREEVGDGPLLWRVPVPQHLLLVISSSPTFATPHRSPVRGTGFHHARPLIGGCRTRRPRPGPLLPEGRGARRGRRAAPSPWVRAATMRAQHPHRRPSQQAPSPGATAPPMGPPLVGGRRAAPSPGARRDWLEERKRESGGEVGERSGGEGCCRHGADKVFF